MTKVRFATNADRPAVVELGRGMHVESRYGWMVYSADRLDPWCCLLRYISERIAPVIGPTRPQPETARDGVTAG